MKQDESQIQASSRKTRSTSGDINRSVKSQQVSTKTGLINTSSKFIPQLCIKLRSNHRNVIQKIIDDINNCIQKSQYREHIKTTVINFPVKITQMDMPASDHIYAKTNKTSYIIKYIKCSVMIRAKAAINKQTILSVLSPVNINSLSFASIVWAPGKKNTTETDINNSANQQ